MAERNIQIDQLKGLGIILVVFGHCIEPFRNYSSLLDGMFVCIYFFHMPLFCILSGMLAKFRIRKWLLQICWEYLLAQILYSIFRYVFLKEDIFNEGYFYEIMFAPYWHLWYLYALLLWLLMIPVLKLLCHIKVPRFFILAIYSFGALVSGCVNMPYSLMRPIVFGTFFLVGYLYKTEIINFHTELKKKLKWRILLSIILSIGLILIGSMHDRVNAQMLFEYKSYRNGVYTVYDRGLYLLVGSTFGVMIYVCTAITVEKLCYLGRHTLTVFVFHAMLYKAISMMGIYDNVLVTGNIVLYLFFSMIVTFLCVYIFSRGIIIKAFDFLVSIPEHYFIRHLKGLRIKKE